ncbi:MAG: hypothetical protein JJV94_00430 [Sulfurospirillum sp.]|nr:hypothetical protein [Sulfurospirillum sp.]
MLIFYILIKTIHLITVMFFISVVSFRTFIMPVLRTKYDKHTCLSVDKLVGLKARSIIRVNNIFLILSGLYLFSFHLDIVNALLYIKVFVGLFLASTFYIVPIIMKKFNHVKWFSQAFHYLFFSLMIVTVVLSQLMFI